MNPVSFESKIQCDLTGKMSEVATQSRSQFKVLAVNNDQNVQQSNAKQLLKNEPAGNVVVYYVQNGNEIVEHR